MSYQDGIIMTTLAVSAGFGFWRGVAYELISIGGWFGAFATANWLGPDLAPNLSWVSSGSLRQILAWGLTLVLSLVAAALLGNVMRMVVRAGGLGVFDRSLGGLFGLFRGLLIVLLFALLGRYAGWFQSDVPVQNSVLLPLVLKLLGLLSPFLPVSLLPAAIGGQPGA